MRYSISDIKKDVRIILDSNSTDSALLDIGDADTLMLDDLIESKIEDACRYVLNNAEGFLLGAGKNFENLSVSWFGGIRGVGPGYILLPDDFQRLVTFQMSDWAYPVTKVITDSDPLYHRQFSRFGGVRGCPERPVVAISNHPAGMILEFFSCREGGSAYVKSFRYIPIPKKYEENEIGYIDIPEKCYDAVKYYTSFLVAETVEMQTSKSYFEIAKTYLV